MFGKIPKKITKAKTLLLGIYNYNVLRRFGTLPPSELQINITYRCDSRCRMCNIWKMRPQRELSYTDWKKIMRDPIFLNINRLTIAGGEPTLNPELENLTKLFIDSMPKLKFLSLVTNGLNHTAVVRLEKLLRTIKLNPDLNFSITVSIDGVEETHEKMRRVPKAFEKASGTVLALKKLQRKYDFWLGVSCVVCRENLLEVSGLERWCRKHLVPLNYQLVGFHTSYVRNMETKKELDFKNKDKKYLYDFLSRLSSTRSRSEVMTYYWCDMLRMYKSRKSRTTPCPFVIDAFTLDSLGDVYYCLSERRIGNFRNGKPIREIYFDSKNIEFRKKLTQNSCLGCNSACNVRSAIRYNFFKYAWFYLTGRLGSEGVY